MKSKMTPIRFLLLISLSVNLAFILGYLNAVLQKKSVSNRSGRIKVVMKKLKLTPEQHANIIEFLCKTKTLQRQIHHERPITYRQTRILIHYYQCPEDSRLILQLET